ncbi:MAG: YciK family oxidoreductase [Oleispira sp.]|nr:YciK family oxidoreductase [Oleispira sp.]
MSQAATEKQLKLKDRVILVTGASYGIGAHAALAYAREGATVILLGRTQDMLEAVYDRIKEEGLPQAAVLPFDLGCNDEEKFIELADLIATEFGRLDGALLNASVLGQKAPIEGYKWAAWKQVMDINVNGQFLLAKSITPLLERSEHAASLVFTSSSVGRKGRAYWGAYSASKFAIEGLMQIMAEELYDSRNIRVNSLNPGGTRTSMRAEAYPAENPEHLTTPDEIMDIHVYLMSDESKHINGQALDAQPK